MRAIPVDATDIALAVRRHCATSEAVSSELARAVRRALDRLKLYASRPPCAVLLGERNVGKSTAANLLIGDGLLPTNIVVSTRFPTLVRYAARAHIVAVTAEGERVPVDCEADVAACQPALLEVGLPVARLARLEVLDTPSGFDLSTLSRLPGLPSQIIPVWCTMATQAWKGSERACWLGLEPRLQRNGVLAVTGIDRIESERDRARLAQRLECEAGNLFRAIAVSQTAALDSASDGLTLQTALDTLASTLQSRRVRTVERLSNRIIRMSVAADERSYEQDHERLPSFLAPARSEGREAVRPALAAVTAQHALAAAGALHAAG